MISTFVQRRRGPWERSRARARAKGSPRRSAMSQARCGTLRRGHYARLTTTTTQTWTSIRTCTCGSRTSGSSLDPPSFDQREVVAELLGLSGLVPAEELLHAVRDGSHDRGRLIARLIEDMYAAQQQVLDALGHFPLHRIRDFGPDLRSVGKQRSPKRAVAIDEIENRGSLAPVVRHEMVCRDFRDASRTRRLDEHVECGCFATR